MREAISKADKYNALHQALYELPEYMFSGEPDTARTTGELICELAYIEKIRKLVDGIIGENSPFRSARHKLRLALA